MSNLEETIARTPLAPPARAEFRAELRRLFLTGEVAGTGLTDAGPARPAGRLLRYLMPLAAAAAIVAVTVYDGSIFGSREWHANVVGDEAIQVVGFDMMPHEEGRIGAELSLGGRLESRSNRVELVLDDELVLEVQPESSIHLSSLPEPGSGRKLVVSIERGEAFLKTLGASVDYPILFSTKETWVRVTGTALGVLVDDQGTCVCVCRGHVELIDLTLPDEEPVPVTGGITHRVFRGASMQAKHVEFGMERAHTDPLLDFARRAF